MFAQLTKRACLADGLVRFNAEARRNRCKKPPYKRLCTLPRLGLPHAIFWKRRRHAPEMETAEGKPGTLNWSCLARIRSMGNLRTSSADGQRHVYHFQPPRYEKRHTKRGFPRAGTTSKMTGCCTHLLVTPTHTHTHTHGRRDKQGTEQRRPECTKSRQVQRQNKDMFKRGTKRLSAVQGQERSPATARPQHPVQPLAASTLDQSPAACSSQHPPRARIQCLHSVRFHGEGYPSVLSVRVDTVPPTPGSRWYPDERQTKMHLLLACYIQQERSTHTHTMGTRAQAGNEQSISHRAKQNMEGKEGTMRPKGLSLCGIVLEGDSYRMP